HKYHAPATEADHYLPGCVGCTGAYSQWSNSVPRSRPATRSHSVMKSSVVTLRYWYSRVQAARISKNASSPTARRRACTVIAPRRYTAEWNSRSGPGSPGGTVQNSGSAPGPPQYRSNSSVTVSPPCASSHSHSAYVANPSLSQMSRHCRTVTLSPNHWCANSCTITQVPSAPPAKKAGPYTGRLWVSNANPTRWSASTTPPYAENGYGPNHCASRSAISPVRASCASIPAGRLAWTATTTGRPRWVDSLSR